MPPFSIPGEIPPCIQNILSPTIAATGIQLKHSQNIFHILASYLLLPTLIRILTLIIKPVYTVNTCTLVIPSKQKEVLRVFDLIGEQQTDGLEGVLATVHVVTQKEVVGMWGIG